MEYWVAMNAKELQISLLLLQKMELPGVMEVASDFSPQYEDMSEMIRKKFFENGADGVSWNPFVKTVLWCVANAQSELRIDDNQTLRHLYFYGEEMILMTREASEDLYVFYYVPLLPKAIGGLAKSLSGLETDMPSHVSSVVQSIPLPAEIEPDAISVKEVLDAVILHQIDHESVFFAVDGWCFGEHSLENLLTSVQNNYTLVSMSGNQLLLKSVGFIDFIQHVSRWIVRTHGRSIAAKEKNNGRI